MAVLPLAATVVKLRLGPGIGARVVSRFLVVFRNGLGITVSDKTCITVIAVVRASPFTDLPLRSLLWPRAVADVSRDGIRVFR